MRTFRLDLRSPRQDPNLNRDLAEEGGLTSSRLRCFSLQRSPLLTLSWLA